MKNSSTTLSSAASLARRSLVSSPTYAVVSQPEHRKIAMRIPPISVKPAGPEMVNHDTAR